MFVYLHGFASSPASFKAQYFYQQLKQRNISLQIPILDEGDFFHLTLTRQRRVVKKACEGKKPLILIGSSMGGYLASLYAAEHPVDALILMAPAFDFAARWQEFLGKNSLARWKREKSLSMYHYKYEKEMPISFDLMDDASRHEPWPEVSVPTLVFYGKKDKVVPEGRIQYWVSRTPSAKLVLFDAGHELTECVEEIFTQSLQFLCTVPKVLHTYPTINP